jgi:hypothetical protein
LRWIYIGLGKWQTVTTRLVDEEKEAVEREQREREQERERSSANKVKREEDTLLYH